MYKNIKKNTALVKLKNKKSTETAKLKSVRESEHYTIAFKTILQTEVHKNIFEKKLKNKFKH